MKSSATQVQLAALLGEQHVMFEADAYWHSSQNFSSLADARSARQPGGTGHVLASASRQSRIPAAPCILCPYRLHSMAHVHSYSGQPALATHLPGMPLQHSIQGMKMHAQPCNKIARAECCAC